MPVIHMLDKAIANSLITCRNFNVKKLAIDRGSRVKQITEEDKGVAGNYLRFKLSNNPISPMVVLGTKGAIFWNSGDEHTEEGHITEDPEIRVQMMDKRMSKLDVAINEIPDEDKAVAYGSGDIVIVSWGSTKGAILDAMDKLADRRHEGQIYPSSPHAPIPIRAGQIDAKRRQDCDQHRDELHRSVGLANPPAHGARSILPYCKI